MFTERLNELLTEVCRTTTGEFARITKYDRSYITHLRNGDRIPKPGYRASERLARAIYVCAAEKGAAEALAKRVGVSPELAEEEICAAVNAWLFEGQEIGAKRASESRTKPAEQSQKGGFGRKLGAAMELANISSLRLARTLNVDVSVIGKYRSGLRVPRVNHPLIHDVSVVLTSRIYALDRIAGLCRLTGVPRETLVDENAGAQCLEAWLRDFSAVDTSLIESFLEGVDQFSPDTRLPLLSPERAADGVPVQRDYHGVDGLRGAVLRFLSDAAQSGQRELLLYSDQDMEWMVADRDFTIRWMTLMSAYVRAGGRIRIIHNVDRGLEEMIAAIRSWLPLYISGGIESWYCLKRGGERFSHTLFLAPGRACVSATCVAGREENACYRYETDAQELGNFRVFFEDLLADCRPLLLLDFGDVSAKFSSLMRDDTIHFVARSLSLGTMPEELLRAMLSRAGVAEDVRREILAAWAGQSELIREKLKSGVIHECVPLPDEKALFALAVPADIARVRLCYTPEEYAEHVRSVLALSERCPGYRFHPLSETPFERIRLAASEHAAVIGYLSERPINFTAAYPLMCRAFVNFAERLEGQYDFDRLALKEMLKRYM